MTSFMRISNRCFVFGKIKEQKKRRKISFFETSNRQDGPEMFLFSSGYYVNDILY